MSRVLLTQILVALVVATGLAPAGADEDVDMAAQQRDTVAGNTRFALDLYGKLRDQDGNLFFSPLSISAALAMTYAGARGETAQEMAQTLHFDVTGDDLHAKMGRLLDRLKSTDNAAWQLHIANALWPQAGYTFLDEFFDLVQQNYHAGLDSLDFAKATEEARKTINTWVEKHTAEKIKDLIPPGVLDAATTLVLTNAVYFKASWVREFDPNLTKDGPFTLANGEEITVPLMKQTGEFAYAEDSGVQVLELPYSGDTLSMVILLPKSHDGLSKLEAGLTTTKLEGLLSELKHDEVHVLLPRFKATSMFSLEDALSALGMRRAFSGAADFSGMTGRRDLFIGAVLHKAYVDVNEEGTEAAAATAVIMKRSTAIPRPQPVFRADHPFMFLIRDKQTGSIMFMGRITDPR
ncbi:MAG: serpin family protein [Phycisphaerae bacterium]|nr:serpin family protein [Phycisphaerae bacterium]